MMKKIIFFFLVFVSFFSFAQPRCETKDGLLTGNVNVGVKLTSLCNSEVSLNLYKNILPLLSKNNLVLVRQEVWMGELSSRSTVTFALMKISKFLRENGFVFYDLFNEENETFQMYYMYAGKEDIDVYLYVLNNNKYMYICVFWTI